MLAYAPKAHTRKFSPASLALAIALPGSALAALLLATPQLITIIQPEPPIVVQTYKDPPPPPPNVEPVDPPDPVTPPPTQLTKIEPIVPIPVPTDIYTPFDVSDTIEVVNPVAPVGTISGGAGTIPTEIVREEATLLTPSDRRRPPYPERRRRMGDEATLKLTLTIGANGRVIAVEPVGQQPADFLREAERHIKRVWRYAPATEDGRNVQSVKTITLRFTLIDA